MPTFEEYEESEQDSVPLECYKFVGSFQTYYYTSAPRQVSIGAEDFLPITISRSQVKGGTQEDDTLSLDLTLPFDLDVVTDYAYSQTPPRLELFVYRYQADEPGGDAWSLYWQGVVRGFNVSEQVATIKVPSIFSLALQGEIPGVYYQVPCNHVLYDSQCKASRAAHSFEAIVGDVSNTVIELTTIPTVDNNLAAGEIVNLRTGERRLILSNLDDQVTIGYPFVDIVVGDEVELTKGCDHTLNDCKVKFNNVANHLGFKYIPQDNPFEGSVA